MVINKCEKLVDNLQLQCTEHVISPIYMTHIKNLIGLKIFLQFWIMLTTIIDFVKLCFKYCFPLHYSSDTTQRAATNRPIAVN